MYQNVQEENSIAICETELARRANVSTAVLRKWRREGKGPRFLKLGRLIRYLVRDVDAWLEAHAVDVGAGDADVDR
jgi:hypothetical protein